MTAVVRGAAIFGIEKAANESTTKMYACPRSYGVLDNTLFSEIEHQSTDRVTDPLLNTDMVKNQFRWLIKKGDLVLSNRIKEVSRPFDRMFTEFGSKKGSIEIFAYSDDDLPGSYDNTWDGNYVLSHFQSTILTNDRRWVIPNLHSRV